MRNETKRIHNALKAIREKTPWVGFVLQGLNLKIGDYCRTMATDAVDLLVNPEYTATLTNGEIEAVCVHEGLHVINKHPCRIGSRDHATCNRAADHSINEIVVWLGYKLPVNALVGWRDSMENIYNEIYVEPPEPDEGESGGDSDGGPSEGESESESPSEGDGDGDGDGNPSDSEGESPSNVGEVLDYPLKEGETMADAMREIDARVESARQQVIMAGKSPTTVEMEAFARLPPTVDWHDKLAAYMEVRGGADYSLAPPNLVLMNSGIIANRLNPNGLGNIVWITDNSGSMNEDLLNQGLSDLEALMENLDYETLRVIGCDSKVNFDRTFSRGEAMDLSGMGCGGGTRFSPAFDLVNETCNPDLVIYFTDMQVYAKDAPEDPPPYPVLWLVEGMDHYVDGDHFNDDYYKYWGDCFFTPDYGNVINMQ